MPDRIAQIETPMARVVRTADALVEIHLRPEVRVDVAGLEEALDARKTLMDGTKGAILFVAHGDLNRDSKVMQHDLFAERGTDITAVAVLVSSRVLGLTVKAYCELHPTEFPTRVDGDEGAVRAWLVDQPIP